MIVLGAGLAGCLFGALNKDAQIYESNDNTTTHQAILRFRSPVISEAIGIPFEKVKVYKGIWHDDKQVPLSPNVISLYSRKVSDRLSYRSITNLDTVDRWIAPANFLDQLKEQCYGRIIYNCDINKKFILDCQKTNEIVISTIPLGVISKYMDMEISTSHNSSSIYVNRYFISDCDVYMTQYYTGLSTRCYRASINKNILIIESVAETTHSDFDMVCTSFGITGMLIEPIIENHIQKNGKMIPIDEAERRAAILKLTIDYGIYSLGRFATWRNILMDDVYKDILVIKRLMNKDKYEHYKEQNQNGN